jgi:hypothetical protein
VKIKLLALPASLTVLSLIISACSPAAPAAPAQTAANTEAAGATQETATAEPAAIETPAPNLVIAPETLGQLRQFWSSELVGDPDADPGCEWQLTPCTYISAMTDYAFSPDGNTLAVAVCDGVRVSDRNQEEHDIWGCEGANAIVLFDSETGEETGRLTPAALPLSLAFHPDEAILVAGLANSDIEIWDLANSVLALTLPGPVKFTGAYPVAFALNGERLVSATGPGRVTNTPNGRTVVGADVSVWDWRSAELVTTIEDVVGVSISPDGRSLATNTVGNEDGDTVRIYDLTQEDTYSEFVPGDQFRPEHIYFDPNNGWIATVEEAIDAIVANFWDPQSYELFDSFAFDESFDERGFLYDLNSGGFTPDGYFLLTENGPTAELQTDANGVELEECGFALADIEADQIYYVSDPMTFDECDAAYVIYGNKSLILSQDGRYVAGEGGWGVLHVWGIDPSLPPVEPACYGDC